MFSTLSSLNVYADGESNELQSEKEITDLNKLYDYASKGITDNTKIEEELHSTVVISGEKGTFSSDDVLSTTQRLKAEQTDEGLVESYVTTIFASVDINRLYNDSNIQPFVDKGGDGYDPTASVKAYSRIYYNVTTSGGLTHYAITQVTGGWTSVDAFVSFKNAKVIIAQIGFTNYTGCPAGYCNQKVTNNVTGSTFSYTSPMTGWKPVSIADSYRILGVTQEATLYDASSSWLFTFENNLLR